MKHHLYNMSCFLTDNGTSLCCCWADDARADLLLRLQEIAILDASVNLKCSKGRNNAKIQRTLGSCLEKMLKKHKKVIVKNYGIPPGISCRDWELLSDVGNVLSSLEEELLKFIVLNACRNGTLVSSCFFYQVNIRTLIELSSVAYVI